MQFCNNLNNQSNFQNIISQLNITSFKHFHTLSAVVARRNSTNKSGETFGRKENGVVASSTRRSKGRKNLSPLECHFLGGIGTTGRLITYVMQSLF